MSTRSIQFILNQEALSAKIKSPYDISSKQPDFKVISLSQTLPAQPVDRKITAPTGLSAKRYFVILLY